MNRVKIYKVAIFCAIILFLPALVKAQILPACTATGNCGLCEFIQAFVNVVRWVLGVAAGTALFLLVWNGFSWISSGGNKEKVDAGRKGLINTVIGLMIVIGSWMIVNIVLTLLLTTPQQAAQGQIAQNLFNGANNWYQYCQGTGNEFCQQGWGEGTPCSASGKFCLKRAEVSDGKVTGYNLTCDNTYIKDSGEKLIYLNACHYWSKYPSTPANPPRLEYKDYNCVDSKNDCVGGKILGEAYCTNKKICCLPADLTKYEPFEEPETENQN